MIAMEMGAPDPIDDDEIAEAVAERAGARFAEPAPCRAAATGRAQSPEPVRRVPIAARRAAARRRRLAVRRARAGATESRSARPSSRAASLRKPAIPANDPLAPIRRMSQAEKIAFFS